jgi:hypothetical protein
MVKGSRVLVFGTGSYGLGKVMELRPPDDLPDLSRLPGCPPVDVIREIMRERGVTRVALISVSGYPEGSRMFAALEIGNGWQDLHGQALVISEQN